VGWCGSDQRAASARPEAEIDRDVLVDVEELALHELLEDVHQPAFAVEAANRM
jgi:hypothetical protein